MNINKALVEWRKTKDISLASDICSALIEMLEDEDCNVSNLASFKRREASSSFVSHNHGLLLIRQSINGLRMSVLEDKDEQ